MAGFKFSGNANRTNTATAATTEKKVSKALFRTGLFSPGNAEIAAKMGEVAQVQVKEDLTIPAGSYLSIRQPREGSSDKIVLNLVVNPGQLKSKTA